MLQPRQRFRLEEKVRLAGSRGKQTSQEASNAPQQRQVAVLHGARGLAKG